MNINARVAMALVAMAACSCAYHDLTPAVVDCRAVMSRLVVTEQRDITSCMRPDGVIALAPVAGWQYKLDDQDFSAVSRFEALAAGVHRIIASAAQGCADTLFVALNNYSSNFSIGLEIVAADNNCLSGTGVAKLSVKGGIGPYKLFIDEVPLPNDHTMDGLDSGPHVALGIDAAGCSHQFAFEMPPGATGVSWKDDIEPIVLKSCAKAGCHAEGSGRLRLVTYEDVKANAANVKARTQNGSMPYDGPLPADQVKLIGCWVEDGAPLN